MSLFTAPSRGAASAAGVGGLAVLILAGRLAPVADDTLFVAAIIWLFAWTAIRFALDLNGIPERPEAFRFRIDSTQYSLGQLWLDRS
jgi:hypothetical protein